MGHNAPVANGELWEAGAAWWQAECTAGADVEYEEQILPLVAQHLAGCTRIRYSSQLPGSWSPHHARLL